MQYWHGGRVALTYYGQENISFKITNLVFYVSRQ